MTASPLRRLRVLVADDNPGVLRSIARLLDHEHEMVGAVADGTALLDRVQRLQPDVVVLDLSFTDVESLEACRLISGRDPRVSVIVYTVQDDAAVRRRAFDAGAVAFVNKLSADELLTELERLRDGGR